MKLSSYNLLVDFINYQIFRHISYFKVMSKKGIEDLFYTLTGSILYALYSNQIDLIQFDYLSLKLCKFYMYAKGTIL